MTSIVRRNEEQNPIMERVITVGDLAKLSPEERTKYYFAVCESLGLNPLTKPFDLIVLNGKMVLYANRTTTDQLRSIRKVSLKIISREKKDDVYTVVAQATTPDGRCDESTGVVSIGGLKGDALANACMKAETKAKRRVTLSIVGLGWLDESEVDSIPGAQKQTIDISPGATPPQDPKQLDGGQINATSTVSTKPIINPKISEGLKIQNLRKGLDISEDELMQAIKEMDLPTNFKVMTLEQMQQVTKMLEEEKMNIGNPDNELPPVDTAWLDELPHGPAGKST